MFVGASRSWGQRLIALHGTAEGVDNATWHLEVEGSPENKTRMEACALGGVRIGTKSELGIEIVMPRVEDQTRCVDETPRWMVRFHSLARSDGGAVFVSTMLCGVDLGGEPGKEAQAQKNPGQ